MAIDDPMNELNDAHLRRLFGGETPLPDTDFSTRVMSALPPARPLVADASVLEWPAIALALSFLLLRQGPLVAGGVQTFVASIPLLLSTVPLAASLAVASGFLVYVWQES